MKYLIPVGVLVAIVAAAMVILWILPKYFLLYCGIAVLVLWIYILFVREWLVDRWPDQFKWWHEQVEDKLWDRSRTILTARLYWVGSIVIALHEFFAQYGMDWTPITQEISKLIPEQYRGLALALMLGLTGIAFEWLRRVTTESLTEKKGD